MLFLFLFLITIYCTLLLLYIKFYAHLDRDIVTTLKWNNKELDLSGIPSSDDEETVKSPKNIRVNRFTRLPDLVSSILGGTSKIRKSTYCSLNVANYVTNMSSGESSILLCFSSIIFFFHLVIILLASLLLLPDC